MPVAAVTTKKETITKVNMGNSAMSETTISLCSPRDFSWPRDCTCVQPTPPVPPVQSSSPPRLRSRPLETDRLFVPRAAAHESLAVDSGLSVSTCEAAPCVVIERHHIRKSVRHDSALQKNANRGKKLTQRASALPWYGPANFTPGLQSFTDLRSALLRQSMSTSR